jgi:hypothetical protein
MQYPSSGASERIVLAPARMYPGLRKIGQSADMIEVHVGDEDVFYIRGIVSQVFNAIDRGFIRVKRHGGDEPEHARHPAGINIIFEAKTGIQQNQSLIGFDEQAGHACFQFAGPAGVVSEAIEQADGHISI